MLKKYDKVVMHTCIEAEQHNGEIWTCETNEYSKGEGVYLENLVLLEGFSGAFSTRYLQKVNVDNNKDLWIVEHWDNGILYRGYDKEKAFGIYEEEKKIEKEMNDVFETEGTEYITIFKAVKDFHGIPNINVAMYEEQDFMKVSKFLPNKE